MAKLHVITYGCQMNEYDSERVAGLAGRERSERRPVLDPGEAPLVKIAARPPSADRVRAYVTVMEGCEKHCTFCVVPRTRGRERSHPPETIVAEVRGLVAEGCREVTLLGQTVNAYGRDLTPPTDLPELLRRVNDVEGLARIRFTTSNPYNLTPRMIAAMRDVPKVCEWFHLPLQSGSNRVLERMHRGYTRQRYLELIEELRAAVPDIALSTDLIVGFPGETEEDFAETLDMVERVGYDNVFVFRYSQRPGTSAATMPDQVAEDVKASRNTRLLEAAARTSAEQSGRLAGRTVEVLVDGTSKKNTGELSGRTRCNRVVNFDGQGSASVGDVVHARVTEVLPHSLRAALEPAPEEAVCSSR